MRILISADMEGISGIFHGDMTETDDPDFGRSRELMTGDVNAAIEGALDAGASDVWVNDSHGSANNILLEKLHPKAHLIQGWGEVARMMDGVDEGIDAGMLVGYHARALTEDGAISHTMVMRTRRLWYNGVEIGEYGISAAHAGDYDVPIIFVSGDEALARKVHEVLGEQVEAAAVKSAYTRQFMRCLPLDEARELIRSGAAAAVARREKIPPFKPGRPIEVKLQYHKPVHAKAAALVPTVERVDELTVRAEVGSGLEAANMVEILLRVVV